jgi:hypothetical protein
MPRCIEPNCAMVATALLLGVLTATAIPAAGESRPDQPRSGNPNAGLAAMDQAVQDNKYLYVFFWKANDQSTQTSYGRGHSSWLASVSGVWSVEPSTIFTWRPYHNQSLGTASSRSSATS